MKRLLKAEIAVEAAPPPRRVGRKAKIIAFPKAETKGQQIHRLLTEAAEAWRHSSAIRRGDA
jgi:hypothetical protein